MSYQLYNTDIMKPLRSYISEKLSSLGIPIFSDHENHLLNKRPSYLLIELAGSSVGSKHKPLSRSMTLALHVFSQKDNVASEIANEIFFTLSENNDFSISEEIRIAQFKPNDMPFYAGKNPGGMFHYVITYELIY